MRSNRGYLMSWSSRVHPLFQRLWLLCIVSAIVTVLFTILPTVAFAHPLGNFTINRYSRLEFQLKQVRIRYVLDLAEIPAYQEMGAMHPGQGQPTDREQQVYLAARVDAIKSNLALTVDGHVLDLVLEPGSSTITFPPGQGGLPLLRMSAWFGAVLPVEVGTTGHHIQFTDNNYADRLGWKEIVVTATNGVRVTGGGTTNVDQSKELTEYPKDMLASPLDVRGVEFTLVANGGAAEPGNSTGVALPRGPDTGLLNAATVAFTDLINRPVLSITFVIFAMIAAMLLGGVHALAPGHGKTIVAAYLVGARGTPRHALILGLTVTATHTIGVFALGLVTLFASRFVLPEQLYPWLSALSGVLVTLIGAWLLAVRIRVASEKTRRRPESGEHDSGQEHNQVGVRGHADHHGHGQSNAYEHNDEGHGEGAILEHDHGTGAHTHILPRQGSMDVRGLLGLGISGGLLPCPSALVVLLAAIAIHRVSFGIVLVCAFSIGLASVLTGIGLLLVYARGLFTRFRFSSNFGRFLPAVSAFVVLLLGMAITVQALAQTGLVAI